MDDRWERWAAWWRGGWPWLGAALIVALIVAHLPERQTDVAGDEEDIEQAEAVRRDAWLRGLTGIDGMRIALYRADGLRWEVASPRAEVRALRLGVGTLRRARLLYTIDTRASIQTGRGPIRITARRAYFDPRRDTWVFLEGSIRRGGERRRFARLAWTPRAERFELESRRRTALDTLMRFWEPQF